jgi:hypothetical protein
MKGVDDSRDGKNRRTRQYYRQSALSHPVSKNGYEQIGQRVRSTAERSASSGDASTGSRVTNREVPHDSGLTLGIVRKESAAVSKT